MTTGPGDVVAVNRHEVVALCLAAVEAAGAGRRVAELLTESALFAEDRSCSSWPSLTALSRRASRPASRITSTAWPIPGYDCPAAGPPLPPTP